MTIKFISLSQEFVDKMSIDQSIQQMLKGIRDFGNYQCKKHDQDVILAEPNMDQPPKFYANTEWKIIPIRQLKQE